MGAERVQSGHLSSRRGFVVALLVFGLTVSLATRGFHGSVHTKVEVRSSDDYQKVLHRDKDALEWSPSAPEVCLLWVTELSISIAQSTPVFDRPHYDSLYNRPPPIA